MIEEKFILRSDLIKHNCQSVIDNLPVDEKRKYQVEIGPYIEPRTLKQNAALFGCAYPPIMEAMGMRGAKDKDDLHEFFCGEYFGWKEKWIMLKKKAIPVRTTTTDEDGKKDYISTVRMADMYDFIQQYAAAHGIWVPDPDPMYGLDK